MYIVLYYVYLYLKGNSNIRIPVNMVQPRAISDALLHYAGCEQRSLKQHSDHALQVIDC